MNKAIVFLRGLLREQQHWGQFQTLAISAFADRTCLFFDIAGNGQFYQQRSASSISEMRQQIAAQLPKHITRFDVVALSMGGMIALDWAKHEPAITSITLINCSLKNFSPCYRRLRWQNWLTLLGFFCLSRAKKEQTIFKLTSNLSLQLVDNYMYQMKKSAIIQHWLQIAKQHPVTANNAFKQLLAAARFRLTEKPQQTIHIIASHKDKLVSAQCSADIAKAWQLNVHRHAWAGHDLALDDPAWLLTTLKNLLNCHAK